MQSFHQQILNKIQRLERGTIFFPEDFALVGSDESIRQALSRICMKGISKLRRASCLYISTSLKGQLAHHLEDMGITGFFITYKFTTFAQ